MPSFATSTTYSQPPAPVEAAKVLSTTYGAPPKLTSPRLSTTYSQPPAPVEAAKVLSTLYGPPPVTSVTQNDTVFSPHVTTYGVPKAQPVECQAVFVNKPRCWSFYVPSGASVDQAITKATEQALQRSGLADSDEATSVTILPSASKDSLVGEWTYRNLEQPPLVIITRGQKANDISTPVDSDAHDMQKVVEDQLVMLAVLQKQLIEQASIVQNQDSFISELQGRSRQQWQQLQESMQSFESDIGGLKGQTQRLQEKCGKPAGDKKDSRRRRRP